MATTEFPERGRRTLVHYGCGHRADAARTPPRPVTSEILLDGPTLTVYDSDPPGQLIEMRFVLEPPLALPRPGLYAFFLQPEDCNTGEVWNITWDGRDDRIGSLAAPGIYFYRMEAENHRREGKVAVVR